MRIRSVWLAGLLLGLTAILRADYYVAQDGQTPSSPYGGWGTAASNIQVAINAASAGDTVWVRAGIYTTNAGANVVSINKSLSLRSETGNPADVTIDGQGARRGVLITLTSPGYVLIDGLTVTNGRGTTGATPGGGVYIKHTGITSGTAVVQRCTISGNYSGIGDGGGMFSFGQSNTAFHTIVADCSIVGNRQESGGSWTSETGDAGGYGGGASFRRTRLTMQDCTVADNADVGGANWDMASRGGGLYLYQLSANSVIRRCRVVNNNAPDTKGDINNSGGGIQIRGTTGYPVLIESSVIQSNGVGGGYGGGFVNVGADVVIRSGQISHNSCGGYGSGILHLDGNTVMESSTVASNVQAAGQYGTGIRVGSAGAAAGGIMTVTNSIVYNNAAGNYAANGTLIFGYSCSTPLPSGAGNTSAVPQFVSLASGDFHLNRTSPCVNAGTYQVWMASARDVEGNWRIDTQGLGIVDMGCYELVFTKGSVFEIR